MVGDRVESRDMFLLFRRTPASILPAGTQDHLHSIEHRLPRRQLQGHLHLIPLIVQHREAVLEQQVVVRSSAVAVEHLGALGVVVLARRKKSEEAVAFDVEIIPADPASGRVK